MFKKILILGVFSKLLFAIEMPPMPPMMDFKMEPSKEQNKSVQKKDKPKLPKECELLPPMVIMLPPPMENMVGKCKNELLKPNVDKNKNIEKLFGKNVQISSIESVQGFNNLYEIKVQNRSYFCNKELNSCFEKSKLITVGK